jgi:hypothetical protein
MPKFMTFAYLDLLLNILDDPGEFKTNNLSDIDEEELKSHEFIHA